MYKSDLVQTWLDTVALSHSGAKRTEILYRYEFEVFLKFLDIQAEDIQEDYDVMQEREFRQKYGRLLRSWSSQLIREGYAQGTIMDFLTAVKSFFKYNDFPLSFVPTVHKRVCFHNRDITKEEIIQVLGISTPREKAFYAIMAQSGLRPTTLCLLKLKDLEPDLKEKRLPLMIKVPEESAKGKYHEYFTFIGEDADRYLRSYLSTRKNPSEESFIFVNQGSEEPMIYNTVSGMFRKAVRQLRNKGAMNYEQKKVGRPAEIRLYNLRKYFRKQAIQAGFENVEFWLGHTGPGVDAAYRPKDPEFYRKIYEEKALPFLRLESSTPTEEDERKREMEKTIEEQGRKIQHLEESIAKIMEYAGYTDGVMTSVEKGRTDFGPTSQFAILTEAEFRRTIDTIDSIRDEDRTPDALIRIKSDDGGNIIIHMNENGSYNWIKLKKRKSEEDKAKEKSEAEKAKDTSTEK